MKNYLKRAEPTVLNNLILKNWKKNLHGYHAVSFSCAKLNKMQHFANELESAVSNYWKGFSFCSSFKKITLKNFHFEEFLLEQHNFFCLNSMILHLWRHFFYSWKTSFEKVEFNHFCLIIISTRKEVQKNSVLQYKKFCNQHFMFRNTLLKSTGHWCLLCQVATIKSPIP